MTEEEYLSLPEEKPYLEYADGMVLQKPVPNAEHADLVAELQYYLVAYRKTHGGRTGPERRVRLRDAPSYRLPDTTYWVAGSLPETTPCRRWPSKSGRRTRR
jgi:Uma2 family endonuclease